MKCPNPSHNCYFFYNGECFATHWWECAEWYRKPHEWKKGNKNNRYCKKRRLAMTKAEIKAHWAIPNETLGDGYTLTHKREREAYVKGYNQAIEDACEYLKDHIDKGLVIYHEQTWCKRDEFINRIKKAMEE